MSNKGTLTGNHNKSCIQNKICVKKKKKGTDLENKRAPTTENVLNALLSLPSPKEKENETCKLIL